MRCSSIVDTFGSWQRFSSASGRKKFGTPPFDIAITILLDLVKLLLPIGLQPAFTAAVSDFRSAVTCSCFDETVQSPCPQDLTPNMSKSPLKRSGPKQPSHEVDSAVRHVSKKRKLAGDIKEHPGEQVEEKVETEPTPAINGTTDDDPSPPETSTLVSQQVRGERDLDKKKRKSKTKHKHQDRVSWEVTSGSGGRFLALDPVFPNGEKYLILAVKSAIHIYSCSTSLLVRSLNATTDSKVTTYALSPTDANILYVGTFSGKISKWNWSTGELISTWSGPSDLLSLVPATAETSSDKQELLYTVRRSNDQKKIVSLLRISKSGSIEEQILLERRYISPNLYLTRDGKILVVSAGQRMLFGAVSLLAKAKGESKNTTWREISLPEDVCSMDILERAKSESTNPKDPALDMVLGTRRGPILIYDDAYGKLLSKERTKESTTEDDLIPRRLHWHRDMVNSVKWSRDGNYIISGGKETVLVIWQLDTSQKQYLPHLSSEITNVTVSPAGTSYAVQLANNTSIVLATSELRPTASMSGLDVPNDQYSGAKRKQRKAANAVTTISSRRPEEILFVASSMLQTFDTRTLQNVSRQALTRNSITEVNVNPSGTKIDDPIVRHMAVSRDGQWLATVDEWIPPTQDLDALYPRQSTEGDRRETFLKFWRFNETEKLWELTARIDGPHLDDSAGQGSILDLQANPARLDFATIGDDGLIKIWSPKGRVRDGQPVKDNSGQRLLDWSCRCMLKLSDSTSGVRKGSVAFSEDGSVLAASLQEAPNTTIKIVDTIAGTIQSTVPITSSRSPHLGIISPYLIIFGSTLQVFDLVRQTVAYAIPITYTKDISELGHLTVNPSSQTFAVTFPIDSTSVRIPQTQIAVFSTEQARPLLTSVVNYHITSLVPEQAGKRGYVTIDEDAVIRRISPSMTSAAGTAIGATAVPEPEMKLGLADMFGTARRKAVVELAEEQPEQATSGATSSLLGVRRADNGGVTPVTELFEMVARSLIGRK